MADATYLVAHQINRLSAGIKTKDAEDICHSVLECRGSGTRTHDLFNPIEARYQAAPCPDCKGNYSSLSTRGQTAWGMVFHDLPPHSRPNYGTIWESPTNKESP